MQRIGLSRRWMAVILAAGLTLPFAMAMTPGGGAKKLAEAFKTVKIKAADAIAIAEKRSGGTAFGVEFEVEKGTPLFSVNTLVTTGDPEIVEVEVNAQTGAIIEVDKKGGKKENDDDDDDDKDDDKDDKDDD